LFIIIIYYYYYFAFQVRKPYRTDGQKSKDEWRNWHNEVAKANLIEYVATYNSIITK